MDRNQVIGFGLLAALLIGYIFYNQHEQKLYFEHKHADSVAYAQAHPRQVIDSVKTSTAPAAAAVIDSATEALRKGMPPAYYGNAETVTLENKKLAVTFNTKGAYPTAAMIKNFTTYNHKPLYLFNGAANFLSATLPFDKGKATADLYFKPTLRDDPNGDKSIDFSADLGGGKKVDFVYTLPADDYMMRCNVVLTGIPANNLPFNWQVQALKTEKDMTIERSGTQVYYRNKNEERDYFTLRAEEKTIKDESLCSWLGFRKQYFSTALIADDGFTSVNARFFYKSDDSAVTGVNQASLQLPLRAGGAEQTGSFKWYIGANDYRTLKSYKLGLEDMVPLGYGVFAFVKYINKFALIPIFYFLAGFIGSYGVIIMLMTLLLRLVLSFFTYKSYLSSAKMRVLKPELDELRAKIGDDQQKFSMEQMKLYRTAGVNPLGGCLPMLFQLPILLSVYYMLPSFIEFRQHRFLWAPDLSTYDSIVNFGFNIPWYGDHISLFTLIMTASSLFLAI